MKKALITGVTGQDGSYLAELLLEKGYEFTVTNSEALIQTGQTVWPIPALAKAGLVLISAGTVILRKQRRKDG